MTQIQIWNNPGHRRNPHPRRRTLFLVLLLVLFVSAAHAETNPASKNPDQFICNTSLERTAVELALDQYHRQSRSPALGSTVVTGSIDRGNTGIIRGCTRARNRPIP